MSSAVPREESSEERAAKVLDALVSRASDRPQALAVLAGMLEQRGERERARSLALRARELAPADAEIEALTAEVLNAGVPDWQFSIVRDQARNAAFDAALRRAVHPGARVLDIGSGTGLLAMMAARAGAGEVVSCEVNPAIADAARKVIAANGFQERIRIVARHSDDLDVQADLGGCVDVIVSEIISNDMLSEGVLPAIEKARGLLKPDGHMIPARASVRVALAHYTAAGKRRVGMVDGFDLSAFNELSPQSLHIRWHDPGITLLSDAADLFTFEFAGRAPLAAGRSSVLLAARSSAANGVAQWIYLQLDDSAKYENHPIRSSSSNWAVLVDPFPAGLAYAAGDHVKVSGSHDRRHLRVWTERV